MPADSGPTRAELLAALSVAVDLGLGQPAEHMLRSALIGTRICDVLGLDRETRDVVYYATLIMWIGCHADSHEFAGWFGDDISVRHDSYFVDSAGVPYYRFLLTHVARGEPLVRKLTVLTSMLVNARGHLAALIHSHCTSAALLAEQMGLSPDVRDALRYTFERHDGGGLPAGAAGDDIPVAMRVAQIADLLEVHHRVGGTEAAVTMMRSRRGGQFDPWVADAVVANAERVLAGPAAGDSWAAALREAPDRDAALDDAGLDALLCALGDFVDLKCPFMLGHSRAVAKLAADAVEVAGLDPHTVAVTRRAGHVHDLGRIGVSNQIWSKPGGLSSAEFERVRLHPYLTGRILQQVHGLDGVARLAGTHHEHVNGTGYPHGISGPALGLPDRILAAAVSYQSALESRPYRVAMPAAEAERRLHRRVAAGELDPVAVDAVRHAAGRAVGRSRGGPSGLTPREVEVLRMVAGGASNKQIAQKLVISEKTVRNHVERVYGKVGVSNRIGASLFALEHGLGTSAKT